MPCPEPVTTAFQIVLYEEDNPALKAESVALFAPREEIIFELPEPDPDADAPELRLYYGNPYAFYPRYDLETTYDEELPHLSMRSGEHADNADFAYSIMEPPVSIWIIRALFFLGLIGVMIPAVPILRKYAAEVTEADGGS